MQTKFMVGARGLLNLTWLLHRCTVEKLLCFVSHWKHQKKNWILTVPKNMPDNRTELN